jgi:multiple sugar transport system substrate-binding protein
MKKNVFMLLFVCVLAAGIFAGGKQDSASSGGPVTLEFWSWLDEENYLVKIIDAWNAKNPNIQVKGSFAATSDHNQKVVVALSGGATLDVVCLNNPSVTATYLELGQLVNLAPYVQKNNTDISGIRDLIETLANEKGEYFALPYRKSVMITYYNKKIFDDAKAPYPDTIPINEWTWEKYTEIARQLTGGSGQNKIYGILNYEPTSAWWRFTANFVGANNPAIPAHLAEYKKAAQMAYDWSYKYQVQPPYSDRVGTAGGDYAGAFMQGKYGMSVTGDWIINMLNTAIDKGGVMDYDIAPVPHYAGREPWSAGTPTQVCIPVSTKYKDESFAFSSFLAGVEGAKIIAQSGMLPAWSSQEIQDFYLANLPHVKNGKYLFTQKVYSQAPANTQYSLSQAIVNEEVPLYLLQERDLDTTFKAIEDRIKDEVLNKR